mmetsp:Transcript_33975/g.70137  ORF Transcript_33975/g.70137 Transcript_33975/m.70137 type:complete len:91 (-) Transcript_33975:560-832(-)
MLSPLDLSTPVSHVPDLQTRCASPSVTSEAIVPLVLLPAVPSPLSTTVHIESWLALDIATGKMLQCPYHRAYLCVNRVLWRTPTLQRFRH